MLDKNCICPQMAWKAQISDRVCVKYKILSKLSLFKRGSAGDSLGWETWRLRFAHLPSHGQVSYSVLVCPLTPPKKNAFPTWLHLHLVHIVSPQAIIEVALPKELKLEGVEADPKRIFIAYDIWAHVSIHAIFNFSSELHSKNDDDTNYQMLSSSSGSEGIPGTKLRSVSKKMGWGVFCVEYHWQDLPFIIWLNIPLYA